MRGPKRLLKPSRTEASLSGRRATRLGRGLTVDGGRLRGPLDLSRRAPGGDFPRGREARQHSCDIPPPGARFGMLAEREADASATMRSLWLHTFSPGACPDEGRARWRSHRGRAVPGAPGHGFRSDSEAREFVGRRRSRAQPRRQSGRARRERACRPTGSFGVEAPPHGGAEARSDVLTWKPTRWSCWRRPSAST